MLPEYVAFFVRFTQWSEQEVFVVEKGEWSTGLSVVAPIKNSRRSGSAHKDERSSL